MREVREKKNRLLYAGSQTTRGNRLLSADEHMTYSFVELISGMRKLVAAMSTTSVPRVGLCGYRTGAQESAGGSSGV